MANMVPRCTVYPMLTLCCVSMKTVGFNRKFLQSYRCVFAMSFFFAINFVELTFFVFVYVVLHFAVLSFSCVCVQVMNKKYWYLLYTSIP